MNDIEPIKQVLPKIAGFHFSLQLSVGGGYHPHISPNRLRATNPFKFHFLEHA